MAAKRILLFDVDGTLTKARQKIESEMYSYLQEIRKVIPLAVVGGSDMVKVVEQLGNDKQDVLSRFNYVFTENGLVAHKGLQELESKKIQDYIGEEKIQKFINYCLGYMANINLPVKRGNFVEYRRGMLNISPIGRSCTQAERDEFVVFDSENKVREKFVEDMRKKFPQEEYKLQFSIGGQISVDVFPLGWDKTYCLQYLIRDGFTEIHFFGDRTYKGGNDHEIYEDKRTIGHVVKDPTDTIQQIKLLLGQ